MLISFQNHIEWSRCESHPCLSSPRSKLHNFPVSLPAEQRRNWSSMPGPPSLHSSLGSSSQSIWTPHCQVLSTTPPSTRKQNKASAAVERTKEGIWDLTLELTTWPAAALNPHTPSSFKDLQAQTNTYKITLQTCCGFRQRLVLGGTGSVLHMPLQASNWPAMNTSD